MGAKRTISILISSTILGIVLFSSSFTDFGNKSAYKSNKSNLDYPVVNQAALTHKEKVKATFWSQKKQKVKGKQSFDQPDRYVKYFNEIKTREGESEPSYPINYRFSELTKALESAPSMQKANPLNWVERGPSNVGGRTRAIAVDMDDDTYSSWFAGAVSGGIWLTSDKGKSWKNLTPNLPNLAITSIVQAKSNHNVLYAGTGEGFYNSDATTGDGIFKSTDKGNTWTQLESTIGSLYFQNINRIIVDPSDENVLLISSNTSYKMDNSLRNSVIMKSVDGGTTWNKVYQSTQYQNRIQQIIADPNNFNNLYAAVNGFGVIKSTDAGETWENSSTGMGSLNRIELAVAPSNSNRLYASVENGSESDIYTSDDAGLNWYITKDTSGINPTYLGSQGWYDNTINVDPFNELNFFVGGIDFYNVNIDPNFTKFAGIKSVDVSSSLTSVISFINWGGSYLGGGLDFANNFWNFLGTSTIDSSEYTSVEIRFGSGKKQMAHRFLRDENGTYQYKDYVEVPFEIWDVTNNRQLTASFRDTRDNGIYDIEHYNSDDLTREYLTVHAIEYNPNQADTAIAKPNGLLTKAMYTTWPYLNDNTSSWDPNNLPEGQITINYSYNNIFYDRITTKLTHWYGGFSNPNGGTYPYIHADQHNCTIVVTDAQNKKYRIIEGNDGGVFYSDDLGITWAGTQNGYNTTQFYSADKKPGEDIFLGGTQDNGTYLSPTGETASSTTKYAMILGGDGFDCIWSYTNPNNLMGSLYNNRIYRSTNGGGNLEAASNGFTDFNDDNSPFITTLAKSNSDGDLVFAVGPSGIWRTDNFGSSWTLSIPQNMYYSSSRTPIAISKADPQIVWAGAYMSKSYNLYLNVSTDGGLTFNETTHPEGLNLGYVSAIGTHPTNPKSAYALFSYADGPKVVRTNDLGATWEDISGFGNNTESSNGFPDVGCFSLLVMPYDTNVIWVGTEIGIVESIDNGASWHIADNGLPHVNIWSMRIVDDQVVVGTHGRGIWSVKLPQLANYKPPVVTLSPRLNSVVRTPSNAIKIDYSFRSAYDSVKFYSNNSILKTVIAPVASDGSILLQSNEPGTIKVHMAAFKDNRSFSSTIDSVNVLYSETVTNYKNNFETDTTDFMGNGFSIGLLDGFSSKAIHTEHPYSVSQSLTYTLSHPIALGDKDAVLTYKDIAVIEIGDAGTSFGDYGFWDYVIVEATKDGKNWVPLADGYDANSDSKWLSVYNGQLDVDSSLFVEHSINLLSKFAAGDTILIRFRLDSDEYTTGWGWAIDDVEIQSLFTGIENEVNSLPNAFALKQNYPNPFNPATTINFEIPKASKVKLVVYNQLGQEVATLVDAQYKAGRYNKVWNANNLASGVYFYRLEAGNFVDVKKSILLK